MANTYYDANSLATPLVAGTTIRASTVLNKFTEVEQGFSKLPPSDVLNIGLYQTLSNVVVSGGLVTATYPIALSNGVPVGTNVLLTLASANSGALQLNVSATSYYSIANPVGGALSVGDIPANIPVGLTFNGVKWVMTGISCIYPLVDTCITKALSTSNDALSALSSANIAAQAVTDTTNIAAQAVTDTTNIAAQAEDSKNSALQFRNEAEAFRNQAGNIAAGALIDDSVVATDLAWSSSKLNTAMQAQQTAIDTAIASLNTQVTNTLNASTALIYAGL